MPDRRRAFAATSAVVAVLCTALSVLSFSLLPPRVQHRHLQVAAAATDIMVDAPRPRALDGRSSSDTFARLSHHADLLGNLISTAPVQALIAAGIGVAPGDLTARTRLTGSVVATLREPDYEQRANQILEARRPYAIDVQTDAARPIIHVHTRAPSAAAAIRLADAVPTALEVYLRSQPAAATIPAQRQVAVRQLGPARGAVVNSRVTLQIALLTFLVAFAVCFALLNSAQAVVRGWRGQQRDPRAAQLQRIARSAGDWPRTTRVLPWLVAVFLALLWLVPFNTIQLRVSLPFDLKLDRIVLPLLVAVWVLSLAAGAKGLRRPRLTAVHIGVGLFVAAALVSVVLGAHSLDQALEFPLATKKILLLGSYAVFFLLVSSVVRRSEVPAFLTFTLVLAVLCAVGTIWEYRFHYNVFYDLAGKLLPSNVFSVGTLDPNAVDEIGRRLTRGPGEHPLETATMMAMALPIALVGLCRLHNQSRRTTVLYACAACVLFAAAISTYRKSALLAPVSVGLTIAYFRREALVRLAPLGAVAAVVVHLLSPGAFGAIAGQLRTDRLGVGTVTDRMSDYDALRPDLWTHIFFGRGFGSYDHNIYRTLDSEVLGLVVGVGVIGLACYWLMLAIIVLAARRPMRGGDPAAADAGLSVAAAAVAFGVVSFLFDVLEFPHAPYILLSLAGLLAVLLDPAARAQPARAQPTARQRPQRELGESPEPQPTLV